MHCILLAAAGLLGMFAGLALVLSAHLIGYQAMACGFALLSIAVVTDYEAAH